MKNKERHVFLECTVCKNRNYTTYKRQRAAYKIERRKFCSMCRGHQSHKEKKM